MEWEEEIYFIKDNIVRKYSFVAVHSNEHYAIYMGGGCGNYPIRVYQDKTGMYSTEEMGKAYFNEIDAIDFAIDVLERRLERMKERKEIYLTENHV
jgi:hypothetical protein